MVERLTDRPSQWPAGQAAVHGDEGAGHVVVFGQSDHRGCDLWHGGKSFQRNAGGNLGQQLGWMGQRSFSFDRPGRHAVNPHLRSEFEREMARQGDQSSFGRRIGACRVAATDDTVYRRDEDSRASRLPKVRQRRLKRQECASQIDGNDPVPVLLGRGTWWRRLIEACVCNDDVDGAVLLACMVHQRLTARRR
jgi:hypothetical protein